MYLGFPNIYTEDKNIDGFTSQRNLNWSEQFKELRNGKYVLAVQNAHYKIIHNEQYTEDEIILGSDDSFYHKGMRLENILCCRLTADAAITHYFWSLVTDIGAKERNLEELKDKYKEVKAAILKDTDTKLETAT